MNRILLYFLFVLGAFTSKAQYFQGFSNTNYGGTNSGYFNPSSIADSRNYIYANLAGANVNLSSSNINLNLPYTMRDLKGFLQSGKTFGVDSLSGYKTWDLNYIVFTQGDKARNLNLSSEIRGISAMVAWNEKNSVAFSSRMRFGVQVNDLAKPLAEIAIFGLKNRPELLQKVLNDNKFSVSINAYSEYGLTYGREIISYRQHYLKGGLTIKRLFGAASVYVQNDGTSVNFVATDSLLAFQNQINYGYTSEQFYTDANNKSKWSKGQPLYKNLLGAGWGMDIGFTYEWRPDYKKYQFMMDGKKRQNNRKNKYKLKVGGALVDVGSIRYNNSQYVRAYDVRDASKISIRDTVIWGSLDTLHIHKSADFDTAVAKVFGYNSVLSSFRSQLPTALNLQVDYQVNNHVYMGFTMMQSLRNIRNPSGMRVNSQAALIPRVEYPMFEFSMPLIMAFDYRKFQLGMFARLGPFWIGTDNFLSVIGSGSTINGFDLYAGACVPIGRKKWKDSDKDGVSNKNDKCRFDPGPWEFRGCPDTDADGVEDKYDQCPDVPGLKEFNGCPDTDGDGIRDLDDQCPTEKGTVANHGCPDTDGDGVYDKDDICPDEPGKPENRGCPDKDGDGVPDIDDECPDVPGEDRFNGCPDTDFDGIPDAIDKCPTVRGLESFQGCPDSDLDDIPDNLDKCPQVPGLKIYDGCPDSDLDGIPDPDDKCPTQFGTKENKGCPLVKEEDKFESAVLAKEEQDILKTAFDNLEFEINSSTIKESSFESLDKLYDLLSEKPDEIKLYISGHTDNTGNPTKNMKLSNDRAESVKKYLVDKGLDPARIITEGFGQTRPVATNNTPQGRQKNRRVEMRIIVK